MLVQKSKLETARQAWHPREMAAKYNDDRMKILCYAILAPNPHNTQAWKIHLENTNEIYLYVDPDHLLPMTDPTIRQIHMGQGTFLEVLSIAAKEFGYQPEIELFAKGIDPVEKIGKSPVAKITLNKTHVTKDELFDQIPVRVVNRRSYTGPPLTRDESSQLEKSHDAEYPLVFITDKEKINRMADLMSEAMKIETYVDRTHKETVEMLRFNDDEVIKYRDGFNFENMGITGFRKSFIELVTSRDAALGRFFRRTTVNSFRKMAHTAQAIGLIFSEENSRNHHVEVGRQYARVQLTATKLGLAMHPMMQLTQEYEELAEVREKFLEEIKPYEGILQMIFRVGRAESTPHSARRQLESFLFEL